MLSVSVYVLGDKGRTVATVNHSIASTEGVASKMVSHDKLKGEVEESKSDLLHFVPSGAVLLPDFYKAMLSHLEHSQRDYVFCPCLRVNTDKTTSELRPDGDEFSFGQLIVKSWVVKELGDLSDLGKMSRRIISEYRGVEIPHCLYMEM
jgi:hypothetical protein